MPLAHVMLSNTGVSSLAERYGPVHVRGVRSATSAPRLCADHALFVATVSGKLTLNLVTAAEHQSHAAARAWLTEVLEEISECLGQTGVTVGLPAVGG
jgi:hypothetical protein